MKEQAGFEQEVIKRLDIIVSLLLDKIDSEEKVTMTGKIIKLLNSEVSPAEIAKILGKPLNSVTSVVSMYRKRKEKNG